jgi:hypothetical protein
VFEPGGDEPQKARYEIILNADLDCTKLVSALRLILLASAVLLKDGGEQVASRDFISFLYIPQSGLDRSWLSPTMPLSLPPPPNPLPPNDNHGPRLIIVTGVLIGTSIIVTSMRCWVRRVNRQLGWAIVWLLEQLY